MPAGCKLVKAYRKQLIIVFSFYGTKYLCHHSICKAPFCPRSGLYHTNITQRSLKARLFCALPFGIITIHKVLSLLSHAKSSKKISAFSTKTGYINHTILISALFILAWYRFSSSSLQQPRTKNLINLIRLKTICRI